MTAKTPEELLTEVSDWWTTGIIDIHPGKIAMRGYPIEELIGNVRFPEMVWLLLRGELPERAQSELLEAAMVASVDHGPHAPSISVSRMAVTCGLPVNGAMASAINVLDDIHGGAGQQCMELYREIAAEAGDEADPDRAVGAVLERWRAAGIKFFPGFGHRFHPLDPRTPRLFAIARARGLAGRHIDAAATLSAALDRAVGRHVTINATGAVAAALSDIGFPAGLMRGIALVARCAGLVGHIYEEQQRPAMSSMWDAAERAVPYDGTTNGGEDP